MDSPLGSATPDTVPWMLSTIGFLSHLAAAVAFAGLGVALAWRQAPTGFRLSVALASLLTAFWALGHVLAAIYGIAAISWLSKLETIRTAAWIAVLIILQRRSWGLDDRPSSTFAVAVALGFVIALQLALDLLFDFGTTVLPLGEQSQAALLFVTTRLILAISGLVLLHNLYVNSREEGGLAFRLFAVGLGVIFAYDLNLYTLHFLLGEPNITLLNIRGAVNTLAVPLIYLSMRKEGEVRGRFHLSRQAAFHTVSFSMIGLYLILMSLLAYGLRLTGGDWGELLQITFLAFTLILGALVVLSPRFRAEVKVRIARNFYRYRYDYRVEWLRFIDTIDAAPRGNVGQLPIRERLIEAMAAVLDCPGGALLEPSDDGGHALTARWRWHALSAPVVPAGSALGQFLAEAERIVDFDQLRAEDGLGQRLGSHGALTLPDWVREDASIWLAIPLSRRDRLTGIILLERSLVARDLNWEDFDLLRTLGRQGASYLAEAETQAALDEAKSFDEFNRRFAFVMHDLKNVVSQLGLVARNAERHADKPEFRADMIVTLKASVAKMSDLLQLLGRQSSDKPGPAASPADAPVDVAKLMTLVAAAIRRQHPALELTGAESSLYVAGQEDRLEAMLTHLVQNAVDASPADAPVRLRLEKAGDAICITIADEGHGMSPGFVRDELFKPFRSTKEGGFGIGAFEAREIARAHGGRLDVDSQPGKGACFTIILPVGQKPIMAEVDQ